MLQLKAVMPRQSQRALVDCISTDRVWVATSVVEGSCLNFEIVSRLHYAMYGRMQEGPCRFGFAWCLHVNHHGKSSPCFFNKLGSSQLMQVWELRLSLISSSDFSKCSVSAAEFTLVWWQQRGQLRGAFFISKVCYRDPTNYAIRITSETVTVC